MDSRITKARTTNKVLPKAGLNGFDWAFVQGSTFVLRLNFCAKNPRLRRYPKRYTRFYEKTQKKDLDNEFNPNILLVHAPKKYWDELKTIIKKELENKHLNRCEYGHILWHLNGRKNMQDMLDNGFKLITNENGQKVLTAVDCQ